MDPVLPDGQVAVYAVTRRAVARGRGGGIFLGAYGLGMIALFFPWGAPPPPESIDHIVWPMLAVSVAVLLAFVWLRWRRIPTGATGGRLTIGPEGVDYRVGPDHLRLDWARIAAVHPVTRPGQTRVRAVWLPATDPDPPGSGRRSVLEVAHVQSPYRPVMRPDGVLLPLTLFGTSQGTVEEIVRTLRHRHLASKGPGA